MTEKESWYMAVEGRNEPSIFKQRFVVSFPSIILSPFFEMETVNKILWKLPELALARFPFISAFTLLMILAERDEK